MIYFSTKWIKQIHYASSSFSSWRRFASKPNPVTPAKAPRTIDDLEASVPVFGNLLLEFTVNSDVDLESKADMLVESEADALVLSLIEADAVSLTLVDNDSDTEVDWLVLVDCGSEVDRLALVDCDSEVDRLVLVDCDAVADWLSLANLLIEVESVTSL